MGSQWGPTAVGKAFGSGDREWAVAQIIDAFRETGGNISKSAFLLGFCRRHLYRIIWKGNLWAELDAARTVAVKRHIVDTPDWLAKTRRSMR